MEKQKINSGKDLYLHFHVHHPISRSISKLLNSITRIHIVFLSSNAYVDLAKLGEIAGSLDFSVQMVTIPFQLGPVRIFQNYNNINLLYIKIYKFIKCRFTIHDLLSLHSKKISANQTNQYKVFNTYILYIFFFNRPVLVLIQWEEASNSP